MTREFLRLTTPPRPRSARPPPSSFRFAITRMSSYTPICHRAVRWPSVVCPACAQRSLASTKASGSKPPVQFVEVLPLPRDATPGAVQFVEVLPTAADLHAEAASEASVPAEAADAVFHELLFEDLEFGTFLGGVLCSLRPRATIYRRHRPQLPSPPPSAAPPPPPPPPPPRRRRRRAVPPSPPTIHPPTHLATTPTNC